ncbi:MAG: DNA polymerase III subunit delta' [Crocinitomicaceae bacterium]|nr:DNA polymerase III subunit delta' [Crocinitomicaceae bacterium]
MQFKDVIGQNAIKAQLIKSVKDERVSHAQLFLGNLGHGALALSIAYVQYLFCENKTDHDSCGTCPSCRKMEQLQHPDVHYTFPTVQADSKVCDPLMVSWREQVVASPYFNLQEWSHKIDPKGRNAIISVHQSQELINKLTLKSFEGGYKVAIVWMADAMKNECANKLLKLIEEPPPKTLIILLAEQNGAILPTILSRTQILKVKPLPDTEIQELLRSKGINNSDLISSIALRSEGNVIAANAMLSDNQTSHQNRTDFIQLMRVCFKKDVLPMFDWSEKLASYGKDEQKDFLAYALFMVRQSIMKNYTNGDLMRASQEEIEFLEKFARFITNNNILPFTQLFNDAIYHLDRNANPKILFTNITFEVMRYIHRA